MLSEWPQKMKRLRSVTEVKTRGVFLTLRPSAQAHTGRHAPWSSDHTFDSDLTSEDKRRATGLTHPSANLFRIQLLLRVFEVISGIQRKSFQLIIQRGRRQ